MYLFYCDFFLMDSCCVAHASLKLAILLHQPPSTKITGMHHCAWLYCDFFKNYDDLPKACSLLMAPVLVTGQYLGYMRNYQKLNLVRIVIWKIVWSQRNVYG
jgi:hypothetical protein